MKCEYIANHRMNRRRRHAFTLVELLLVLAILALLAGLVLPKLTGQKEKANIKATITQIAGFKGALELFEVDNGKYPPGKNGLNDLMVKPRYANQDWKQYMERIPVDPWGNAYIYECPGRHNPNSFDLSSPGPDGKANTDDDIKNWDK